MTTNVAQSFVSSIPSSEEEMLDICREIVARNKSVGNFKLQIEYMEQLVAVMEEYLQRHKKKVAEEFDDVAEDVDPVNHDCPLCKKKEAASDEIPPEEAAETPALNEIDDEEGCGCGDECECDDCKAKAAAVEENVDIDLQPSGTGKLLVEMPACRVLTLATTHEIKSQYILGQKKTTLSTTKLQVDEDRVRFKFNTFEHVLPIQLASHKATVVNEAHEFGTQTVRLVLAFEGKTFPTLVDLVEGEEDVLSIGTDLYEILRKDRDDVSPK